MQHTQRTAKLDLGEVKSLPLFIIVLRHTSQEVHHSVLKAQL